MMTKQPPASTQMKIIYLAMLFAASTIGSVFLLMSARGAGITGTAESTLAIMRVVCYGAIITQVSLLFVLRNLRNRQPVESRSSLTIAGWATAESAALLGAVFILLGGEPWPWVGGLAMLVLAGQLFPADENRE